jgi:hypothetical protein
LYILFGPLYFYREIRRVLRVKKGVFGVNFQQTNVSLAVLAVFFVSCADRIVTECEQEGELPAGVEVTFSEIQSEIFTRSCAIPGCHSGQFAAASLDLSEPEAYDNLVNIASRQEPSLMLVAPGKSAQSYIVSKMKGDGTSVMPPGGALDDAVIQSVVTWIDNGAADN